jgi:Flp pilus assembly pilin Flp
MAEFPNFRAGHSPAIRLIRDAGAASAAEYALLLGLIGGCIAVASLTLGDSISCAIDRSASVIAGDDVSPGHQYGHSDPNGNANGHRQSC